MKHALPFSLLFIATIISGCGGDSGDSSNQNLSITHPAGIASCPAGIEIFSTAPVALDSVTGWEPLGHMGPPGHTFPTDHQYLYLLNPDAQNNSPFSVPLLAPANIRITYLYRYSFQNSGLTDYSIFFLPCSEIFARFGHVGSVSADVLAAAGPIDQECSTYEASPGNPITLCHSRAFNYPATNGEQIGTAGDGASIALDWWLQDNRVSALHFTNATRFATLNNGDGFDEAHIVPASEYFVSALSAQITAKIGRYDGNLPRTALPLGGSIEVDVDNTARGYWFNPAEAYPSENYHAALAPDYIQPDILQAFSIGLSQPNLDGAVFGTFTPLSNGTFNRAFEEVTADAQIYCYEITPNNGAILLQLLNATTLRMEVMTETSCTNLAPYTFGTNAFDYER